MASSFASQIYTTTVLSLGLIPTVFALSDQTAGYSADRVADFAKQETIYPPSYFSHKELANVMYAHIALMTTAWIFILPVAIVLSLARSRYMVPIQVSFFFTNAIGIVLATIYSASTPDLYPSSAHQKIGWIITCTVAGQILLGLISPTASRDPAMSGDNDKHTSSFNHHPLMDYRQWPRNSGDRTNPGTELPCGKTQCEAEPDEGEDLPVSYVDKDSCHSDGGPEAVGTIKPDLFGIFPRNLPQCASHCIDGTCKAMEQIILPLAFIAVATGLATYGRFFEGNVVLSGLTHWIKGGVMLWFGLFTLARWAGSFANRGWAWNASIQHPPLPWRPSAEFLESRLILFCGFTNILLDHLNRRGEAWGAHDSEHLYITVLLIGGGLSSNHHGFRDLLNTRALQYDGPGSRREKHRPGTPPTYETPMNPIPALIIFSVGTMMSSRQQESMISSMLYRQEGTLLTRASMARGLTYIIMYLKPPTSTLPSRPPTELLVSFGLIAGGIFSMCSPGDMVAAMTHFGLDPIVMYNSNMGLAGLLMAWELIVLAIKAWAERDTLPWRRSCGFHV